MEVFILKGYGNSLNYRMGVPLLEDIVQSMEKAITAKEGTHTHTHLKGQCWKLYLLYFILLLAEKRVPGSYEKARLRFAHAETVLPFTCLLGLFLEGGHHGKCFFSFWYE